MLYFLALEQLPKNGTRMTRGAEGGIAPKEVKFFASVLRRRAYFLATVGSSYYYAFGEVAEWLNAPHSKCGLGKLNVGSNPTLSASLPGPSELDNGLQNEFEAWQTFELLGCSGKTKAVAFLFLLFPFSISAVNSLLLRARSGVLVNSLS